MPEKPSPESVARAARLREQIDRLVNPGSAPPDREEESAGTKRPRSPREFIEEQMRNLDRKK